MNIMYKSLYSKNQVENVLSLYLLSSIARSRILHTEYNKIENLQFIPLSKFYKSPYTICFDYDQLNIYYSKTALKYISNRVLDATYIGNPMPNQSGNFLINCNMIYNLLKRDFEMLLCYQNNNKKISNLGDLSFSYDSKNLILFINKNFDDPKISKIFNKSILPVYKEMFKNLTIYYVNNIKDIVFIDKNNILKSEDSLSVSQVVDLINSVDFKSQVNRILKDNEDINVKLEISPLIEKMHSTDSIINIMQKLFPENLKTEYKPDNILELENGKFFINDIEANNG